MTAEIPHYALVIEWDPEDSIYVVIVPELVGCMTHGRTYEEAIHQARDAIATWVDGALADGEDLPAPLAYPALTDASRRPVTPAPRRPAPRKVATPHVKAATRAEDRPSFLKNRGAARPRSTPHKAL